MPIAAWSIMILWASTSSATWKACRRARSEVGPVAAAGQTRQLRWRVTGSDMAPPAADRRWQALPLTGRPVLPARRLGEGPGFAAIGAPLPAVAHAARRRLAVRAGARA